MAVETAVGTVVATAGGTAVETVVETGVETATQTVVEMAVPITGPNFIGGALSRCPDLPSDTDIPDEVPAIAGLPFGLGQAG